MKVYVLYYYPNYLILINLDLYRRDVSMNFSVHHKQTPNLSTKTMLNWLMSLQQQTFDLM